MGIIRYLLDKLANRTAKLVDAKNISDKETRNVKRQIEALTNGDQPKSKIEAIQDLIDKLTSDEIPEALELARQLPQPLPAPDLEKISAKVQADLKVAHEKDLESAQAMFAKIWERTPVYKYDDSLTAQQNAFDESRKLRIYHLREKIEMLKIIEQMALENTHASNQSTIEYKNHRPYELCVEMIERGIVQPEGPIH